MNEIKYEDCPKRYTIKEVGRAECSICGSEKECITFTVEGRFLLLFPSYDVFNVCETCLSRGLRHCKKGV